MGFVSTASTLTLTLLRVTGVTFIRHFAARHHLVQQNPEGPDVRFDRESLVNGGFRRRPSDGDLRVPTGRVHAVLQRDGSGLTSVDLDLLKVSSCILPLVLLSLTDHVR